VPADDQVHHDTKGGGGQRPARSAEPRGGGIELMFAPTGHTRRLRGSAQVPELQHRNGRSQAQPGINRRAEPPVTPRGGPHAARHERALLVPGRPVYSCSPRVRHHAIPACAVSCWTHAEPTTARTCAAMISPAGTWLAPTSQRRPHRRTAWATCGLTPDSSPAPAWTSPRVVQRLRMGGRRRAPGPVWPGLSAADEDVAMRSRELGWRVPTAWTR
jgi:hypothetical protein